MLPLIGPQIYTVRGASGLALPVATAVGSPTESAELVHTFTRPMFIAGILGLVAPLAGFAGGLEAQQAMIAMTILDENQEPIVGDTRGTLEGANQVPPGAPFLALSGRAFHPHPLQRQVVGHNVWRFRFQNFDPANAMTLAGVFLYLEPPR